MSWVARDITPTCSLCSCTSSCCDSFPYAQSSKLFQWSLQFWSSIHVSLDCQLADSARVDILAQRIPFRSAIVSLIGTVCIYIETLDWFEIPHGLAGYKMFYPTTRQALCKHIIIRRSLQFLLQKSCGFYSHLI